MPERTCDEVSRHNFFFLILHMNQIVTELTNGNVEVETFTIERSNELAIMDAYDTMMANHLEKIDDEWIKKHINEFALFFKHGVLVKKAHERTTFWFKAAKKYVKPDSDLLRDTVSFCIQNDLTENVAWSVCKWIEKCVKCVPSYKNELDALASRMSPVFRETSRVADLIIKMQREALGLGTHSEMFKHPHPKYVTVSRAKIIAHDWTIEDEGYNPPNFTHDDVINNYRDNFGTNSLWADADTYDESMSLEISKRPSLALQETGGTPFMCKYGLFFYPRNPMGRTGLIGRGLLGKYGANLAADPIITRVHGGQPQFVAILRTDLELWALPGGMKDLNDPTGRTTARREFMEETMNNMSSSFIQHDGIEEIKKFIKDKKIKSRVACDAVTIPLNAKWTRRDLNLTFISLEIFENFKKSNEEAVEMIAEYQNQGQITPAMATAALHSYEMYNLVKELFDRSVKVYSGYVDDPRNTDWAWMETEAYHAHIEDHETKLLDMNLNAGDDAKNARWINFNSEEAKNLYASHVYIMKKTLSAIERKPWVKRAYKELTGEYLE